jgi:hypothetical protein
MPKEELMACQPRYFDALVGRRNEAIEQAQRAQEFMFAQLTAMVANSGFLRWENAPKAQDFMPSEWSKRKQEQEKPKRMRPRKIIAAECRSVFSRFRG